MPETVPDSGSGSLTRTTPTPWIPCVKSVATVFATVTAVVAAICAAVVAMRNDGGAADDRCCPASTLTPG
jgi:hypothetical protein